MIHGKVISLASKPHSMKHLFNKASVLALTVMTSTHAAMAQINDARSAREAFLPTNSNLRVNAVRGEADLLPLIFQWINNAMWLLGIVAVLIIIWSGVKLIISQGNEDAIKDAKKTLIYAAAGFALIVLSGVIVNTILGFLGSGQITS